VGVRAGAPDGRVWHVCSRIAWPRWRGTSDGLDSLDWLNFSPLDLDGDDPLGFFGALFVGLLVAVLLGLFIVFFLPLILFVVEALVVIFAAVLLGRRWVVVASTDGPPQEIRRWHVRGWRASRRGVREVADELQRGVRAEPEGGVLDP
jgi:hypothetical protein